MATNLQIKFIRSLQLKKNRDENKLFVCEGTKIVEELVVQTDYNYFQIFAKKSWIESHPHCKDVIESSEVELQKMSSLNTAPEVLAVVHYSTNHTNSIPSPFEVYLDQIADPGNMGTIIRTCDWYAIKKIYLSPQCVDIYNPKVVQASMGSIFRIRFEQMILSEVLSKNNYNQVLGAVLQGQDFKSVEIKPNSLLVMGSESHGILPHNLPFIDTPITIPRYGNAESLNVSVATGIILEHLSAKLY